MHSILLAASQIVESINECSSLYLCIYTRTYRKHLFLERGKKDKISILFHFMGTYCLECTQLLAFLKEVDKSQKMPFAIPIHVYDEIPSPECMRSR